MKKHTEANSASGEGEDEQLARESYSQEPAVIMTSCVEAPGPLELKG